MLNKIYISATMLNKHKKK